MNKENIVKQFADFLETLEDETKPLTISPVGSKARQELNHLAETFWMDLVTTCEKYNVDIEQDWPRLRKNLSHYFSKGSGYARTRPLRANKNRTKPNEQFDNDSKDGLTVKDFIAV